jgi:hypothetical protein
MKDTYKAVKGKHTEAKKNHYTITSEEQRILKENT